LPNYFKKIKEAGSNYETSYIAEVTKNAKGVDEADFSEIWDEMVANHNIRRGDEYDPKTWNPSLDAQLNWAKAEASVYKKRAVQIKPNVKGGGTEQATGITAITRQEPSKKAVPQLDAAAVSVLKGSGLTDEEITEALTADDSFFVHQRGVI
jgi:hypothetical protein